MKERKKVAAAVAAYLISTTKRKKRTKWVRTWIAQRKKLGFCDSLMCELEIEDPIQLQNFLRMSQSDFEDILNRIAPKIQRRNTGMREAIPAKDRLAVTLRFLATGK